MNRRMTQRPLAIYLLALAFVVVVQHAVNEWVTHYYLSYFGSIIEYHALNRAVWLTTLAILLFMIYPLYNFYTRRRFGYFFIALFFAIVSSHWISQMLYQLMAYSNWLEIRSERVIVLGIALISLVSMVLLPILPAKAGMHDTNQ